MGDQTIRTSEIGTFHFCNRAWWYEKQGVASTNAPRLEYGTTWHQARGRRFVTAGRLQFAALSLIFVSLLIAILMRYLG
ncbi:MAG: hypothetical protein ACERK1_04295 [Anaerolineales bacterium]